MYNNKQKIERNTKTSFTNRNKIKTQSGPTWLTVPIKTRKGHSSIINQVLIDNRSNWKRKHFNSLKIKYSFNFNILFSGLMTF